MQLIACLKVWLCQLQRVLGLQSSLRPVLWSLRYRDIGVLQNIRGIDSTIGCNHAMGQ